MEGTDMEESHGPPPRISSSKKLGRMDSLERDAGKVTGMENHGRKILTRAVILRLAFQTIGVVYGDIGTSPLYVFSSTFPGGISRDHLKTNVLGVLSLIIYTLTLSPLIKYVFVVLRANDNGEGGAFALYSLICRNANVDVMGKRHPEDKNLSAYKLDLPNQGRIRRGIWIKNFLEGHKAVHVVLLMITFFGTCMVIGDGTLTPSISVLSAVQGIQVQVPNLSQSVIVVVSIVILICLFSVQRFGTDKVGFMFAPVLTIWFAMIAMIGLYNLIHHDHGVLAAFNPKYIFDYFKTNKREGFISLGGVVLCITGTEAMFADLGHFSVPSIQIAFTTYVYPSLLLAYIGQAAYLMEHPEDVGRAFYKSVPKPLYWPMFVVAVLAAIIASQAMISAVFQIIKQAEALGCFPRIKVVHTSKNFVGQVYIPEMNWFLMCACVLITAAFRDTTTIGNAYGICVVMDMAVTTTFTTIIMVLIWKTQLFLALLYLLVYWSVEFTYFSAVVYKFKDGGWLPLLFAALFLTVMVIWFSGNSKRYKYELDNKISMDWITGLGSNLGVSRVRGVGLVYTELAQGIPSIFSHYITNLPAMHSVIMFVTIKNLPVSNVLSEERFLFRRVGSKEFRMYRCIARYGYKDCHRGDTQFEEDLFKSLAEFISIEDDGKQMEARHLGEADTDSCSVAIYPVSLQLSPPQAPEESAIAIPGSGVVEELGFLEESRKAGVVYLLGDNDVRAREDSSFINKFVVDYGYAFLRKNFRESTLILNIPHTRLLKVGMVYFI
ncbi:hypothetical protein SELMODRAFT_409522 [Selaginella moellendorffii]|uniref:Potassium transporter n=1 Tax=Selaginella moellendorffii TaxID=88036 RepID=D8RBQ7_SELML|nr:potassium transporter 11 [Selaginella moellendorffii]EFJ30543.1 hypothetical protein SELMODRAFT_409522 [Selaginella moellendorffii]|eukprot:XP_002968289.1 potassium transporter 11 [Selaginella moellendorffii]